MTRRSKPYEDGLYERLRDDEYAAEYLRAMLDEDEGFLLALRDVAEARQGIGKLAKTAHMNRENLYRVLSASGNPRLSSLEAILEALGLRLSVIPTSVRTSPPNNDSSRTLPSWSRGRIMGSAGVKICEEALTSLVFTAALLGLPGALRRKPPKLEQNVPFGVLGLAQQAAVGAQSGSLDNRNA